MTLPNKIKVEVYNLPQLCLSQNYPRFSNKCKYIKKVYPWIVPLHEINSQEQYTICGNDEKAGHYPEICESGRKDENIKRWWVRSHLNIT